MHREPSSYPCPCGQDHSDSPFWEMFLQLAADQPERIRVRSAQGVWELPRVFLAFHGLRASDLPALVARYGFPLVAAPTETD